MVSLRLTGGNMDEVEVKVVISAIVGFMLGIVLAVAFTMLVLLR